MASVLAQEPPSNAAAGLSDVSEVSEEHESVMKQESIVEPLEQETVLEQEITLVEISQEIIASGISTISKTGDGTGHAFIKLDVNSKEIESIQTLSNFPHLRYVDISKNNIQDIKPLQTMQYMLSLNASNNKIQNIPFELNGTKFLQLVNISNNEISTIQVTSLPLLNTLNMNSNKLDELTLTDFPNLVHLECRANEIEQINALNTIKLEKLFIAQNKLRTLSCLENKPVLEYIHARDNKITVLDGFTSELKSLSYLNLRSNQVSELQEVDKLVVVESLRSLNLSGNPITQVLGYRNEILMRLPQLTRLDKVDVTEEERKAVDEYKIKIEEARLEALRIEEQRLLDEANRAAAESLQQQQEEVTDENAQEPTVDDEKSAE